MELRVLHGEQLRILGQGAGIGVQHGSAMVEIQKPNEAGEQQEHGEHGELFLLLHAAVLK
jgi:hypothetical protein